MYMYIDECHNDVIGVNTCRVYLETEIVVMLTNRDSKWIVRN